MKKIQWDTKIVHMVVVWSCRWIQKQENRDGIGYLGATEERSVSPVKGVVILQGNLCFLPSEWGTDSISRQFICSA